MKPMIATLLLSASLFAADGYEVYKKHCASCHFVMLPLEEPERGKMMAQMKAPTMRMVALRLKMMINIHNEDEDIQKKVSKTRTKIMSCVCRSWWKNSGSCRPSRGSAMKKKRPLPNGCGISIDPRKILKRLQVR